MTALLTDEATREAARLHVSDYCDVDQGAMEPETKAWAEGIYRAGARFAQGIYEARLAEDAKVRAGLVEDDAESFVWRRGYETGLIDASRPARVRMTDELERLMEAARARAWDCHASGNMSRCEDIRADIAAVRSQAAEAGKVRLPKVRSYFLSLSMLPEYRNDEGRAFLAEVKAELDAAEGRK